MSEHIGEHIKAVFFDHDDTLVGTIGTKSAQHKHVARKYYAKQLSDDEIRQHWGKPLREMVGLLYETDELDQAMEKYMSHGDDFPKELFSGSISTLSHIKSTGRLTGIVTATMRVSFDHDLALHKISRELLDYTQTADDTSFHKPDPQVFEPAIAWLAERGIKPNEVLYVGDGMKDMEAAIGAGFNFIGVETGVVTAEQFREMGAVSIPTVASLAGRAPVPMEAE